MSLIGMSLSGGIFILAVALFRAVSRKRLPKRTYTVLWRIALLRLLLPFEIPAAFSAASLWQKLARTWSAQTPQIPAASPADTGGTLMFGVGGESFATSAPPASEVMTGAAETVTRRIAENAEPSRFAFDPWQIVWIAGVVLTLAVFAVVYVRALRVFRQSLPGGSDYARDWLAVHAPRRKIRVRRSDRIASPLTYGTLRPVILLPSDTDLTDARRLEFVLAHELTHIRHFDSLTKLVLVTAVSLHWFNPAVWRMFFLFNRDIELACDEAVVRMFGGDSRRDYALTLVGLAEKKPRLVLPGNGFGAGAIKERIGIIMKTRKITWVAILAAVIAVAGITAVFATTPAQERTAEADVYAEGNPEQRDEQADDVRREEEEELRRQAEAALEQELILQLAAEQRAQEEELQQQAETALERELARAQEEELRRQEEMMLALESSHAQEVIELENKVAQQRIEQIRQGEIDLFEEILSAQDKLNYFTEIENSSRLQARDFPSEGSQWVYESAVAERHAAAQYIAELRELWMREQQQSDSANAQALEEELRRQEEAALQRELEREEAQRQRERSQEAAEKWHGERSIGDETRAILFDGDMKPNDRLSRLNDLILEFRSDHDFDLGEGSAVLWMTDAAEGEAEWDVEEDVSYQGLSDYYSQFYRFGLTYEPHSGGGIGDLYWNGKPVSSWSDILFTGDGKAVRRYFIFEDNTPDGIAMQVVYDNDRIAGVEKNLSR